MPIPLAVIIGLLMPCASMRRDCACGHPGTRAGGSSELSFTTRTVLVKRRGHFGGSSGLPRRADRPTLSWHCVSTRHIITTPLCGIFVAGPVQDGPVHPN